ncbi:glutamate receptor ionotropic, delta-2, partial [Asbolus verrucosus]
MVKNLLPYKCVVLMSDSVYGDVFTLSWYRRFGSFITYIVLNVDEFEDLVSPYEETQNALVTAKNEGCQMYVILLSNGLQVARLLRFGDRYRVINTRAKFVILYDNRLFEKHLFYLWKRIINVIFIRRYGGLKSGNDPKRMPWFEITTVPFPSQITSILVPKRLDIWTKSKFRKGTDLFRDKTSDLRNQTLKVAAFGHIPGTAKNSNSQRETVRAVIGNGSLSFSGAEVEILQTVSAAMNFKCEIYEPLNANVELWGGKQTTGKYTGLIGEMVSTHADIALGDLYYTPYILELMDLSVPYNTECLTFLTPESLTDNSWKTLILPFKPLMWAAVLICLLICGIVFYALARFHENINTIKEEKCQNVDIFNKKKKIITLSIYPEVEKFDSNVKYMKMKEQYIPPKHEGQASGLYQFSEPFNSVLYTYSMLLLVSLPKLPTGWSLRMLTGWYWLYCLLLVVSYRASMTAILARPTPRVIIDTLQELVNSRLPCGGWGDINREFFKSSLDSTTKLIGENFEIVNDSGEAVDRVAQGVFAFYENSYFLKEALVKRQLRFQTARSNLTSNRTQEMRDIAKEDRTLHIMTDCVIKMPISIGLQKNSPIKPRVDKYIRRVLEAGLIKKWLDDVMSPILNAEIQTTHEGTKAIMNMKKFFGALVTLFIGYFVAIVVLMIEITYFNYFVKKNPSYNKYTRTLHHVKKGDEPIHLISGDFGPFRASLPVKVPLWVAVNLKRQKKCRIQQPDWMDVDKLESIKSDEKTSRTFTKMPSEHYMVEVKLLLGCASDDIPRADEIRTIVKDIWDIRMSKLRSSVDLLVRNNGSYAAVDNLTLMEINSIRPILPHALDQIYRMK